MPTTPTADEQLMLELINRFRADPAGEFARLTGAGAQADVLSAIRYFGVSLPALQSQLAALPSVAPLAWNASLGGSADGHNAAMIAADTQSHQLPAEAGLGQRASDAGYGGYRALGENVYAFASNVLQGHAGFVIDWGYDSVDFSSGSTLYADWQSRGDGIQDPAGHRVNLMNATYQEIGIAITTESNNATSVGPYVVTEDLGARFDYTPQFLGVVINDSDNDDFYDVGEGLGGVTITLKGASATYTTQSWSSGGWQIAVPTGSYTISFSGGGLPGTITESATIGSSNVKLDVEAADAVVAPPPPHAPVATAGNDTLTGTDGKDALHLLAGNDTIHALAGADSLYGDAGADLLYGGDDNDLLYGGTENDRLYGEAGSDTLDGGTGVNTLYGGAGDDIYIVRSADDKLIEYGNAGSDLVRSYIDITLGANVEKASLYGDAHAATGNALANTLTGGIGDDLLSGLGGDDSLAGGAGADTLVGGDGKDMLRGGLGKDVLTGGTLADMFVFDDGETGATASTADRITDFHQAEHDHISLSAVDANNATAADDRFVFIGTAAFGHHAGELRYAAVGGNTLVYGDTNGDGVADLVIQLDGSFSLTGLDFVL